MAIHNRDPFLDRLANALGRPRKTQGVERPTYSVQPQYKVLQDTTPDELVDVLEKQCEVIHTDFVKTTKADLTATLKSCLATHEGQEIIASRDERNETFRLNAFYEDLRKDLVDVHIWDKTIGKENQVIAERADVGITFSDMTLAESGTVALFNNADHGRSISLLPQAYIALIPKSTLVPRITQVAESLGEKVQRAEPLPSCVSLVTGPSNSADIEMHLIVGVHGPVKATYILIEDA